MEAVLVPVPVLDSEVLTAGVRDPSPKPGSRGEKAKQNPAPEEEEGVSIQPGSPLFNLFKETTNYGHNSLVKTAHRWTGCKIRCSHLMPVPPQ